MLQRTSDQAVSYFGEPSLWVWRDETYFVAAFQDQDAIRLDIHRVDAQGGLTWDDLREIKRQCGFANYDAVEFYPREADVINTGNARHLYVFTEPVRLVRRAQRENVT